MAYSGVVSVVDTSNQGGEGRRLSIDLDDGRRISYIHLDRILVSRGARVARGQFGVAISGASGWGDDFYYGPHVHVSLWNHTWDSYANSIDFENYIGDDDMPLDANNDYAAFSNMLQRALRYDTRPEGNGPTSEYGPTIWERLNGLESNISNKIDDQPKTLRTPAWVAAGSLFILAVAVAASLW
jgi:murein DD-endopeptidase MepM/ murein hydrolase activator NlpD